MHCPAWQILRNAAFVLQRKEKYYYYYYQDVDTVAGSSGGSGGSFTIEEDCPRRSQTSYRRGGSNYTTELN